MNATTWLLTVSWLAVIALAIVTYLFRQAIGQARKETGQAEARAASSAQEINRLNGIRALEARLGVVVGSEYSSEHLQAFDLIQNVDILRDAVANHLLPIMSIRQDLSSDPTSSYVDDYPYTSVDYTPELRQEDVERNPHGLNVVRIVETDRMRVVYGADPYLYPGAGSNVDGGRRTIVREVTLRPMQDSSEAHRRR